MATIPSIAMIPSGVKASKLYSVLPTDGTGDFTTTRASVATRVNENGLIEEVASNVPRLDYSDGTCPSLLLEPTATNLVVQSQVFSGYSGNNQIVTDNSIVSPDGTVTGAILADSGLGGTAGVQVSKNVTVDVSSTYTYSVFAKKKDIDFIALRASNFTTPVDGESFFDLNLGTTLGVATGHTSKIENYGNGWYRCSITFTTDAVDTVGTIIAKLSQNGTTSSVDLDNTSNVYIWGFQFEKNSYATSYIKNAGTALGVTRVADTANLSNLTSSGLLNNSAMTFYFENDIQSNAVDSFKEIIALYNDAYNAGFRLETRVNNQVYVQQDSLVSSGDNFNSFTLGANSVNFKKIAIYLTTTQFKVFADGSQVGSTFNGVYTLNFNNIGFRQGDLAVESVIKTKDVRVYTTALSDAELTNLTTI